MATITEDYISFEVAKLLKAKGFDDECDSYYDEFGLVCPTIEPKFANLEHYKRYTINVARKYLRLEHGIHIEPHIVRTKYSYGYMPNYIDLKELKQHFPFEEFDFSNADKYACITFDKACDVTIKHCLENLI